MAAYTTIDNPELYFQVKIYTGDGNDNRAITFDGEEDMQPDWLWFKNRGAAAWHNIYDSVRGANKALASNAQNAEESRSDTLDSFDTNGFTVGNDTSQDPDGYNTNASSNTYVCWAWKGAGGSGSADSNGTINTTSTSANTTSLFSVSTYTGNNSNTQTIGHGLGTAPKVYIQKRRDNSSAWGMYHGSLGANKYLQLESTNAVATDTGIWNNTAPTSTVVSLGNAGYFNNASSATYVSYAFGEKQGFSKFGTYTGNGSSSANSGPFVYLGFKPSLVIVKNTSGTEGWQIWDNKRSSFNGQGSNISPNSANAESTGVRVHFFSNGFQLVSSGADQNTDGNVFIYMAFAEAPFVNSNGVPCNAR